MRRETGQLREAQSESGNFCYALLRAMAHLCFADTQAIEGVNSQIKLISKRCPNISLELLSSRLMIKRTISSFGDGNRRAEVSLKQRKKWSMIKPFAESLVAKLTDVATSSLSVLANVNRWAVADATGFGDDHAAHVGGDLQPNGVICNAVKVTDIASICEVRGVDEKTIGSDLSASREDSGTGRRTGSSNRGYISPSQIAWAKGYNIVWKRSTAPNKAQIKKIPLEKRISKACLSVAVIQPTVPRIDVAECFVVTETFGHSVQFSRLQKVESSATGAHGVRWVYNPHNCVESTLFFMSFFDSCTRSKSEFKMSHCTIEADRCEQVFSPGGIPLEFVVNASVHILDLQASGSGVEKSNNTSRGRGRGRGRSRGRGRRGRTPRVSVIQDDDPGGGSDNDQGHDHPDDSLSDSSDVVSDEEDESYRDRLAAWLADLQSWDDGSDGNDSLVDPDDDDDMGSDAASVIKQAQDSGAAPSTEDVLEKAAELESAVCSSTAIPEAELQEEALLLLLKQSRDERLQVGSQESIRKNNVAESKPAPQQDLHDSSIDSDEETDDTTIFYTCGRYTDIIGQLRAHTHASLGHCVRTWMCAVWKTLECMKTFADHIDKSIGHQRSIALVLLKPIDESFTTVATCQCLRCSLRDETHQLLFVHWLNNSDKHLGTNQTGSAHMVLI